jgi:hypothetical protein
VAVVMACLVRTDMAVVAGVIVPGNVWERSCSFVSKKINIFFIKI